jgi:hypothetical protein
VQTGISAKAPMRLPIRGYLRLSGNLTVVYFLTLAKLWRREIARGLSGPGDIPTYRLGPGSPIRLSNGKEKMANGQVLLKLRTLERSLSDSAVLAVIALIPFACD